MTADLLARIAKALEGYDPDFADKARALLPKCYEALRQKDDALKIAVEALQRVANAGKYGVSEAGCLWCWDTEGCDLHDAGIADHKHLPECPIGQALSRLASTPGENEKR